MRIFSTVFLLCSLWIFGFSQSQNAVDSRIGNTKTTTLTAEQVEAISNRDLVVKLDRNSVEDMNLVRGFLNNTYKGVDGYSKSFVSGGIDSWSTDILLDHFSDDKQVALSNWIYTLVEKLMSSIVWIILPFFLAISIGLNYWNSVIRAKEPDFDWSKLIVHLVIVIIIAAYVPLMKTMDRFMNAVPHKVLSSIEKAKDQNTWQMFVSMVNTSSVNLNALERKEFLNFAKSYGNQYAKNSGGEIQDAYIASLKAISVKYNMYLLSMGAQQDEQGWMAGMSDFWDRMLDEMSNLPSQFLAVPLSILGAIAKWLAYLVSYVFAKILLVLGIFSLLMSLTGIGKDKWITFFGRWLNLKANVMTLVIIDGVMLMVHSANDMGTQMGLETAAVDVAIGFDLLKVFCYVGSFWLTSTYLGSEDAGRFLTEMTQRTVGMASGLLGQGALAGGLKSISDKLDNSGSKSSGPDAGAGANIGAGAKTQ